MRDDVKNLFKPLLFLLSEKLSLLNGLYQKEADKHIYLKSDDVERLNDSIRNDNQIFDRLKEIDFDASSLKTRICSICGVEEGRFDRVLTDKDEPLINEILSVSKSIDEVLKKTSSEYAKLIDRMESRLKEIKADSDSLHNIIKYKIR